jgi:hypothetical protein
MIKLNERLDLHVQSLAVVEYCTMVIRNAPRPGIEIEPGRETARLRETSELFELVATAQCPIAAARTTAEFENLNRIAGIAQFKRGGHPGQAGAKNQDRGASSVTLEFDAALVWRLRRKAESRHRVIHRRASRERADDCE